MDCGSDGWSSRGGRVLEKEERREIGEKRMSSEWSDKLGRRMFLRDFDFERGSVFERGEVMFLILMFLILGKN